MQKQEGKFAQVVSLYPKVREFCRRYPELGAEDLAQDVAVKLLKYSRPIPPDHGHGWLWTVVRNAANDGLRMLMKDRENVDLSVCVDLNGDMGEADGYKVYLAHEIYPEQETDEWTMEAIRAAFDALPETQREVLQLHCDGRSYDEISRITGTSIGTVRSRLHYGRTKAKELLADYR